MKRDKFKTWEEYNKACEKARVELCKNLKKHLTDLRMCCTTAEDLIYRFYHGSFKVYYIQNATQEMVDILKKIKPKGCEFNQQFADIVIRPTVDFDLEHNAKWDEMTRPMLEAYFHADYFIRMAIKYGEELDGEMPDFFLPSGFAALLYLFNLR